MYPSIYRSLAIIALASLTARPAHAQLAVIDVPAMVQLVQEVKSMAQQVQTAENQLAQAQQALASMTGSRGMQLLLSGTPRNYLPTSWPQLATAMQGGAGAYPGLATDVGNAIFANAVLSRQQISQLSPAEQQLIAAGRQSGALQQALSQEALANASGRFAAIQTLINAISAAADQKGILELQARISAELAMLENEQTKLHILHLATLAQEAVNRQQSLEQAIAVHGNFATRFQPTP